MLPELHGLVFKSRALAQSHPFTPRAYRYLNAITMRERESQPVSEVGVWAGHALTSGYCLRRVEESESGRRTLEPHAPLPDDLDAAAEAITLAIRTEHAAHYMLNDEDATIDLLDHLIDGEIDRRLPGIEGPLDAETLDELSEYLAFWVIQGYALCIADGLLPDEVDAQPGADAG